MLKNPRVKVPTAATVKKNHDYPKAVAVKKYRVTVKESRATVKRYLDYLLKALWKNGRDGLKKHPDVHERKKTTRRTVRSNGNVWKIWRMSWTC